MNEIKNNWKVFPAGFKKTLGDCHDERVGIRCIDPQKNLPVLNKVFRNSNYETDNAFKDAIEQFVIQHNNEGYNVYQCVNIVNDDYNGIGNISVSHPQQPSVRHNRCAHR